MQVNPTSLPEGTLPRFVIEVFRDPNGNWFASVQAHSGSGRWSSCTPTYTRPTEAVDRAVLISMADTESGN